jgi:anti-sigma B factor antagonist
MKVKAEMQGDVAVLALKGKLMGGPETQAIHESVKDCLQAGNKEVVINLAGVSWMNSTGLGALMSGFTTIANAGGAMKLANVTDKVQSLLMITQLLKIFECYESVDEAVQSFTG